MSPEAAGKGVWLDLDYINNLCYRYGLNPSSKEEEKLEWALSVFEKDDLLVSYDAAEIVLMRKIQQDELKLVETILTAPGPTPEERLDRLIAIRDL
jgi:hypothetical protein